MKTKSKNSPFNCYLCLDTKYANTLGGPVPCPECNDAYIRAKELARIRKKEVIQHIIVDAIFCIAIAYLVAAVLRGR